MSSIVIAGDTSGTCTLQANAVAGTTTLTLPTTSGTLYAKAGGGAIGVADGGTGATTLTGVLKGNGTSAFTAAVAGTDYVAPGGALGTPASGTLTSCTGLPLTTGVTGTLPVANGGTGTATPSLVAGSGITVTGSFPNQTIAATGGGTVTSVATGNGLSGGTITTSGTLTIACPTFNSVGSYCFLMYGAPQNFSNTFPTAGSNYSAGVGGSSVQGYSYFCDLGNQSSGLTIDTFVFYYANNLSGTWKWMSATTANGGGTGTVSIGLGCRVS